MESSNVDIQTGQIIKITDSHSENVWECFCCKLKEKYAYKGIKPPFAKHISFLEECYIMKDPFSPLNRGEILVLGADCSMCKKSVCVNCSIFYAKRFCKVCAIKNMKHFPIKLQDKMRMVFDLNNKSVIN